MSGIKSFNSIVISDIVVKLVPLTETIIKVSKEIKLYGVEFKADEYGMSRRFMLVKNTKQER